MAKTKEEILAALKELEGGEDYVNGFNDLLKESNKNAKSVISLQKQVADLSLERPTKNGASFNFGFSSCAHSVGR